MKTSLDIQYQLQNKCHYIWWLTAAVMNVAKIPFDLKLKLVSAMHFRKGIYHLVAKKLYII